MEERDDLQVMLDILYMQKYTLGVRTDTKLYFGKYATKKDKQELKERLIKERKEKNKMEEEKAKKETESNQTQSVQQNQEL